MASYPSALWVPSHIVEDVTVLERVLFQDANAEVDAIEAELGILVHGTAGSLEERIDLFMSNKGGIPNIKLCDGADSGNRKIMRAGIEVVEADDLTHGVRASRGTLTFSPPLAPTRNNVEVLVELQTLEEDTIGQSGIASYLNFVLASGTTTAFQFDVCTGAGLRIADGTSFIMHWLAIEITFNTTLGFPT